MSFNSKSLLNIAAMLINPEVNSIEKYNLLKSIFNETITIKQLQKTRIGKSVKKCTKLEGKIGQMAQRLIDKWTLLIEHGETDYIKVFKVDNTTKLTYKEDNNNNVESFNNLFNSNVSTIKSSKSIKINKNNDLFKNRDHKIDNTNKIEKNVTLEKSRKRNSSFSDESNNPKQIKECSLISDKSPKVNINNQYNIQNQSDLFFKVKENIPPVNNVDDIDVTCKYSSQKKVWMPNSRNVSVTSTGNVHTECEYINNVSVTEISTYSAKQLQQFEGNDRKIMKKTNLFWQKLFNQNYKFKSKFEDETWRDAFSRVDKEEAKKLKEISDKLNKKAELSKKNESRAILINVPLKSAQPRSGFANKRRFSVISKK